MKKVSVWIEPSFASSQWCNNLIAGMKTGAKAKHLNASFTILQTPDSPPENNAGVILAGETNQWFSTMLDYCNEHAIRCCVASNSRHNSYPVSIVQCDYRKIAFNMTKYLYSAEKRNIAFFGANPSAPADLIRIAGYKEALQELELEYSDDNIFYTHGNIADCCNTFITSNHSYDAVIVSNNYYAVFLLNYLKCAGFHIPDDIFLSSFGNTILAHISKPSITTIADPLNEIGYQSMHCMDILLQNQNISRLSIIVEEEIFLGDSTAKFPFLSGTIKSYFEKDLSTIYSSDDKNINQISTLETCLVESDHTDLLIINGLLNDSYTKTELADKVFLSEGALNYRTDKLIKKFGVKNRSELRRLLQEYSTYIDFSQLI